MKKLIKILFLMALVVLMSVTTVAATETEDEVTAPDPMAEFLTVFDLEPSDVLFIEPEVSVSNPAHGWDPMEVAPLDANVYGDFTFSGGLEAVSFSTFSTEKCLVGQGSEGTAVGFIVYLLEEENLLVVDEQIKELGASGMYTDTVNFSENSLQYLAVAVSDADGSYVRVYEVTTLEAATKEILENINVEFMPDNSEEDAEIPAFDLMPAFEDLEF